MRGAWLCLEKLPAAYVQAREGYGDVLGHTYSWDDRVPHSNDVAVGDMIALWNTREMLGISVIERIDRDERVKVVLRCPACSKTDVRLRKHCSPKYKCGKCKVEFAEPLHEQVLVDTFTADYSAAWTPVSGWDAAACRGLAQHPRSQQSIRPVAPDRLCEAIKSLPVPLHARLAGRGGLLPGGHRSQVVRLRVGQGSFRRQLLEKYGFHCAFVGACHESVLQAAHLYRYAELGSHEEDGGLLMRADLHLLFDAGLLRVNPDSGRVECSEDLSRYDVYAALNGQPVVVKLTDQHKRWLRLHWQQYHSPPTT
jgi:ribosomal protein L37AE/L43A